MTQPIAQPRFNPWPYAIIGFFAVALIAAAGFVTFCFRHPVDLVTADYYEQELRFGEQMNRVGRTQQLAGRLRVAYDAAQQRITLRLPAEHASLQPAGEIVLYRPSAAGLDRKLPLGVDASGEQTLDARALAVGLWRIRVNWSARGQEFYGDEKLVIRARGS